MASPPLRVAVCTNRAPSAVAPCLDALLAQGADVLLVASGTASAAPWARSGVEVTAEPRPGLSAARNRALAECDGLVAYVDDDAEVGPGWHEALRAAWARAEPEVGCIGGPIRARFDSGRPEWLTDAILPMLTTLDLGPAPRALDPAIQAVYGANFSFRVEALRAVGGFDPRWGHQGERPWFGEDDEAQLALARAGWAVRYEPAPWVWHVIPPARTRPRALLRRRFAHGAAVGRRGRRGKPLAARWLLSNAVLAPVAAARGRRGRAMERSLYAAENLGVLLAGRAGPP